jgi:hypothetical protein
MSPIRSVTTIPALIVLVVLTTVLASAYDVSAQATHSATFSTTPSSQTVIYSTALPSPTPVMLTVCQTSGISQVQLLVDQTGVFFVSGCRTLVLTVAQSIQIMSASAAAGTYAISFDLVNPAPR